MLASAQSPSRPTPTPWFLGPAGQVLLASERTVVDDALASHPVVGLPWLWLGPVPQALEPVRNGLQLVCTGDRFEGRVRCRLPLPIASESLGAIVLQHPMPAQDPRAADLLAECARVLVPGGRLALLALNPLSPYRLRWQRAGERTSDPMAWRARLRDAGLAPEPTAHGVGPQWSVSPSPSLQTGVGLRAAYLQRAEKRATPMTPLRMRTPRPFADGVRAA